MHPVLFHIGSIFIPAYGAMAALGVLLALTLAQRTSRIAGVDPNKVWNLSIVALFVALVGSRLLLVIVNWTVLIHHPLWVLGLATIHHPLLATVGALFAAAVAAVYARRQRMSLGSTADALAAPLSLGLACEEMGALMAASGFGTETNAHWAVIYTDPLAARWSGAPLGVPVHPVQAYAALAFLTISICLLLWLPNRRRQGDVAGAWLMATGVAVYLTEIWRDPEGRGVLLGGVLNGPQAAAVVFVLAGALVLIERNSQRIGNAAAAGNPEPNQSPPSEPTHG